MATRSLTRTRRELQAAEELRRHLQEKLMQIEKVIARLEARLATLTGTD